MGAETCWSARVRKGCESLDCLGDHVGPGPVAGEPECRRRAVMTLRAAENRRIRRRRGSQSRARPVDPTPVRRRPVRQRGVRHLRQRASRDETRKFPIQVTRRASCKYPALRDTSALDSVHCGLQRSGACFLSAYEIRKSRTRLELSGNVEADWYVFRNSRPSGLREAISHS